MDARVVYALMLRFIHSVAQEGAAELRDFDLTPAQFQLLVQVYRRPGLAQRQLVEDFGVTKGNVSQLVKRLEQAGLLTRVRAQGSDELTVTPRGAEILGRAVPAHEAFMSAQFAALSHEDLRTLHRLLLRLSR